jgi:phytoene dehydrogenase-like protein
MQESQLTPTRPTTGGERYDAVIVGGGHNGLVAAYYLARAGLCVIVLERRHVLGGPCGTVEFFPGHRASMTNSPGSLEVAIASDMRLEEHGLRFIPTDPTLFTPFDGDRHFIGWRDQGRVKAQLRSYAPNDAENFFKLLAYIDDFAAAIKVSPFAPPPSFPELAARLTTPELEEAFGKIFMGSIRGLAEEWLESEEARALIAIRGIVSIHAGPSTPGTPVPLLIRPLSIAARRPTSADDPRLVPLRGTTGFPKGGMGSIVDAMARAVRNAGGAIQTKADVRRILVEDGATIGVELGDGRTIRAPIVVSNINPKTTLLDLAARGSLPAGIEERLKRLSMKGAAFKVALSLDRPPRFRHARNDEEARVFSSCQFRIAPSVDYMERAYDDAKYQRPSAAPMIWGLCPSLIDPDIAPSGRHLLSLNIWHAPYHLREGSWTDETRDRFGDRCIGILEDFMPGLRDSIVDRRCFSPVDIEREYGLVESNIIQGDLVAGRMFSLRPLAGMSDYRTPIGGLYLCGNGTWPGGFVSGIPGHNAAQEVLRDVEVATARRAALSFNKIGSVT